MRLHLKNIEIIYKIKYNDVVDMENVFVLASFRLSLPIGLSAGRFEFQGLLNLNFNIIR